MNAGERSALVLAASFFFPESGGGAVVGGDRAGVGARAGTGRGGLAVGAAGGAVAAGRGAVGGGAGRFRTGGPFAPGLIGGGIFTPGRGPGVAGAAGPEAPGGEGGFFPSGGVAIFRESYCGGRAMWVRERIRPGGPESVRYPQADSQAVALLLPRGHDLPNERGPRSRSTVADPDRSGLKRA